MNVPQIVDVFIAGAFLVSILAGYFRGLLITISRVLLLIASYFVAGFLADAMKAEVARTILLPLFQKKVGEGLLAGTAENMLAHTTEGIAYSILFFLFFCVLQAVGMHFIKVLHLVDHIPIIGKLNKIGGAIVGFLWVFLLCLLLGNVFFQYVPANVRKQCGFTKKTVESTVLVKTFVPRKKAAVKTKDKESPQKQDKKKKSKKNSDMEEL